MHWHIDTNIISLLIISAVYVYSARVSERDKRDIQARRFLWCLLVGIVVSAIDIAASIVMEVPTTRFLYHLLMTLDFAGLELTIASWYCYGLALLYHDDPKRLKRKTRIILTTYLVYAIFTVLNPLTGLIYSLDENMVYHRGPLFFIMLAMYIAYAISLTVEVVRRRNHLPEGYPSYPLLLTLAIAGFSIAAQLSNDGWLMILPGYTFSMLLAFLFLQTRRVKEQESAKQLQEIIRNVGGGICVSLVAPDDTVTILLANDTYYSMLGYTRQQYETELNSPIDALYPADRESAMEKVREVVASHGSANYEYRVVKRDGTIANIHCQNSITSIPGMGDTVLLAMLSDVTALKRAEEAALVHEEEMRLAMSQMGKMICEYNLATRTLTLPTVYADRYGLSTVVAGVPDNAQRSGTFLEESLPDYLAFHAAIRRGDPSGEFEYRTRWADGTLHWEHAIFYSIFDSAGDPVKAIIAVEDTSEQHHRYEIEQSRPTLGEKNLLAHALFNLSTGETLDYAYRDGSNMPLSERTFFLYGTESKLDACLINAEEREQYRAFNNPQNLLARYEAGETEISMDYRRKLSASEIIWVRNIMRMIREPGGSDILLFEYCYNIEEEKTQALMYSALVNENFDFVGRVNGMNKHYSLLTASHARGSIPPLSGDDMDEMIRNIAVPHTHPDDRTAILKYMTVSNIERILRERDSFQFTTRLLSANGETRYKTLNVYYLDRERRIIIVTREDVTEAMQKEVERSEELSAALKAANAASRAKSSFLSRMSHEMRTPMNAIIGLTVLAGDEENISRSVKESIGMIGTSARYLLSIINDILEISRIESGKVTLKVSPFTASELVAEVGGIITPQAHDKHITYTANIAPNLASAYIGDSMKLSQILINLLGNAVKFTPPGGTVTFSMEQLSQSQDEAVLRFTVSDNGIGIAEKFQPHLFELFAQEASDRTAATAGTGLGLPIVKSLVELMNGTMQVLSTKGEGSTFLFDVRLAIARETVGASALSGSKTPDFSGKHILMAEDNHINALIAQRLLAKTGAKITVAADGQEAVELFRHSPAGTFDVILMDIRMPIMDGLVATETIRALDTPDSETIPIIAVSANAFDEDVELSLRSGMNAHLAKPIEPRILYATLQKYML